MRDDVIRARLQDLNPWWRATGGADPLAWAAHDLTLRNRDRYDVGYRSAVLADVSDQPIDDRLVVLRGPRRVGKSVTLKDTIFSLCARDDVDTRQLVYVAADGLTGQDLHRFITVGRELTRSVDQPSDRPAWFIDEVTGLDGWTTTLKFLRDNSLFGLDLVVCTGSSWAEQAEVGRDLLAGRAGMSNLRRSRILLPMSFRDYLATTRPELPRPAPVAPWDLQSSHVAQIADIAQFSTDAYDLAWQSYLSCGGYPRAVSEYYRDGMVSESFLTDIEQWLHRDIDRDAPEESIPRLLAEIHARTGAPLNRTKATNDLGYSSRQSFDRRLSRLVGTFGAIWCRQVRDDGRFVNGAMAKLYLTDPVMAWLGPRLRVGLPAPDMTRLTESTLAIALAAAVENRQQGRWATDEAIGFHRSRGGSEIDLAPTPLPTPSGDRFSTPVEMKWVSRGWRPEARHLETYYNGGVLATKNINDTTHPAWALPAPLVALLLG